MVSWVIIEVLIEKAPKYALKVKILSKNATKPVMKGTYLTPEMANVLKNALISAGKPEDDLNKMAIKLGYEIPSNELLEKMGYVKEWAIF